jgi:hypothetical protein
VVNEKIREQIENIVIPEKQLWIFEPTLDVYRNYKSKNNPWEYFIGQQENV